MKRMNHRIEMTRRLCGCCGTLLGVLALPAMAPAAAAELPVPCVAGTCAGISTFVTSGSAGAASSGNTLTITQNSDSAILNWQSFNLSRDGHVQFIQPDSSSTALNRIFQQSASQIFGSIQANGRIYLLNQNGFVFGEGAAINVAGLLATSLELTPEAISGGLLAPGRSGNAALRQYTDANGQPLASGAIQVQAGATLGTGEGGSIYMFAPDISNAGTISTPGGQTLLAAGSPVYLVSSADPNLRGLMVEVGVGGTLTNGVAANADVTDPAQLVGQIVAERGNVTLAGLAVNQQGRVSATTSISQNGSIYLQARDGGSVQSGSQPSLIPGSGGSLTLGASSMTEISLAGSTDTTVDATVQPLSRVNLDANHIVMERNSRIVAPHGDVSLIAREQGQASPADFVAGLASDSRIYLASGATIDVSGAEIERPVSSNVITVELRGTELADSPLQRDGALRGNPVQIDTRLSGTREDGSTWVGSPIGNLSGWLDTVKRNVAERNLNGGSVQLYSQGDVILAAGSKVDVSGGAIHFTDGFVNTTALLGADGKVYDIGAADRDLQYVGIAGAGTMSLTNQRWGVTETFQTQGQQGRFEAGYVEGKDAGGVAISGQRVVLDGALVGIAAAGRYQREKPASLSGTAVYRPYDQLPLGGTLVLGNAQTPVNGATQYKDFLLSGVRLVAGEAPTQLQAGFGATTPLAGSVGSTVLLGERLLEDGGFANLVMRANGAVEVAADVPLDLPAFGTMDVRAGAVEVAGDIVVPGGRISLSATRTIDGEVGGGLRIRSGAVLDVAGRWVNDLPLANGGLAGTALVVRNGGGIALAGEDRDLRVEAGALLDVSGGARLTNRNRLLAGTGGSLSFTTLPSPETGATPVLALDGTLVGAALNRGGTVSVTAGALCVAAAAAQCQQQAPAAMVTIAPERFARDGFSAISLRSNRGGIEVAPDTFVDLTARNLLLQQPLGDRPSGGKLTDFLSLGTLPVEQRGAVNFSATVAPVNVGGEAFGSGNFPTAGSLVVGAGSTLQGEIGAVISLTSSTRLLIDGALVAPSGTISLRLDNSLPISGDDTSGYFPDQGIWLGTRALLDASAATRIVTSDLGVRSGDVLGGGSIVINAQRGHVIAQRDSRLDVSGTSAELDLRSDARGGFMRTTVGSAGGLIDISASEAIVLGGSMEARSGAPGMVRGGELRLTLDPTQRLDTAQFLETPYSRFPSQDRTIEISQQGGGQVFSNQNLPALFRGRALLGVNQIEAAGFDAISLSARAFTVRERSQQTTHLGRILLAGDLDLSLGRSLTLNAAVLASSGGAASISVPLLTLGHVDQLFQNLAPLTIGTGRLNLDARQLDVRGSSVLQGFATARLQATGDLRLTGTVPLSGFDYIGYLGTGGSLELSANQVYPTTLSQFTVAAGALNGGTLTISRPAAALGDEALSAGGQLRLDAPRVVQNGTLLAPFGSIAINAPQIDLGAGSVTSTSGAGLVTLFGSTQGGFDWVYSIGNSYTRVFGASQSPLPSQRITLSGAQVRVLDGAVLDSRGGGSLLATEFIPGTTGTVDVLADAAAAGTFAVLPAHSLSSVPFDPQISISSAARPGVSVHLAGVGGLPEGDYVVLPARYALLPGAFLVKQVSGYTDITGAEQYALRDGSTVVSGYFMDTGTTLRDARSSGFAVMNADTLAHRARYTVTDANAFFTDQAEAAGVLPGRLPRDAGTVAVLASNSLVLDGTLRGTAAAGGRGVALDIASDQITVTADGSGTYSGLVLSAADLRGFGAESLLLGGTRSDAANGGVTIDTVSRSLTVTDGAQLQGSELLLVARDTLEIQSGGEVASGSGDAVAGRDLALSGDGALLRVARGSAVSVERSGVAGATGDLLIRAGATLRAPGGAINLESTRGAQLAGSIAAQGGALAVTGNLISLGAVPATVGGFVLSNTQLQALGLNSIRLRSRTFIDLYGGTGSPLNVLSGGNVDLQARSLRAMGGDVLIDVTGTLGLRGETGDQTVATAAGNAPSLEIRAGNVLFEGGALGIEGFHSTALQATGELRAAQDSSLDIAGDLHMEGARLSGASGVDLVIGARGQLAFAGRGAVPLADLDDLGASISLAGQSVRIGGPITLHSGRFTANASAGGVTLDAGARVDLSGLEVAFVDASAFSPGGTFMANATADIQLLAGSRVNASGAGSAAAGQISLRSQGGELQLASGSMRAAGAQGSGDLTLEARLPPSLDTLATEWANGGFTGALSVRQRGVGDLNLGTGSSIRGRSIELTADHGNVNVLGTLRAAGPAGGRVRIVASDGIQIGGTLDATPVAATDRNGRIGLEVSEGGLRTLPGSRIATTAAVAAPGSAADGLVQVRLPRTALQALLDGDTGNDAVRLEGDWSQTAGTRVEGFQVYTISDGSLGTADVATTGNPLFTDTSTFAAQAASLSAALNVVGIPSLQVRPGIELRSAGDLALDADWNLTAWRLSQLPGTLTLRAGGNLVFNRSLSDGFSAGTSANAFTLTRATESWSYRLVGGADPGSADVMATQADPAGGSVRVAAGDPEALAGYRMVRTGTGSIDVRAAGDIELGNSASMIYTAGISRAGIAFGDLGELGGRRYPFNGGDISLVAGRDIRGADSGQLVTDWLWRVGNVYSDTSPRATAWTVAFGNFRQNVAALGGGDVMVKAGGDIDTLSVSTPTIGFQSGGTTPEFSLLTVTGQGSVDVRAEGDVLGGIFYAGRGAVRVAAGDSISVSSHTAMAPVVALGDGSASLQARRNLDLQAVVNPTLLPQALSQNAQGSGASLFSTYSAASRIALGSIAGDIRILPAVDLVPLLTSMDLSDGQSKSGLRLYPGTLEADALRGDVEVNGSLTLFPAVDGRLSLRAMNDLRIASGVSMIVSDVGLESLPNAAAPVSGWSEDLTAVLASTNTGSPTFNAPVPIRQAAAEAGTLRPTQLIAQTGDVDQQGAAGALSLLYSGGPVLVHAGRDVRDLSVIAQNLTAADVTRVSAGRDIRYGIQRAPFGTIATNSGQITVDGPGYVMLQAGRDINFQNSAGVTTRGSLINSTLPATGASISLLTGLNGIAPHYAAFAQKYLEDTDTHGADLLDFLTAIDGARPADLTAARARFSQLDPDLQQYFLQQVLLMELRTSGRNAASTDPDLKDDYTAGFDALETLFPGANPDREAGEINPYAGDVALYFSRVYTLAGGDISMLAPGGGVNAGLSTPPSAFGVPKAPSQLGIVAQSRGSIGVMAYGDLQVNESRVFAADGGNILVWSTGGDIDAGRGAKTAVSAPPPIITIDENGRLSVSFPAALTGSGIQTLATSVGVKPGNVDLFAPRGIVNAGDAGIVAGNLTIGATAVLGADNIKVSGVSVGVAVDAGGLGASLQGVSSQASSASSSAMDTAGSSERDDQPASSVAEDAMTWLEVFVLGFGEETCKPDDEECLKRERQKQ
jgi:filamentous hemagglutinin family protein